MITDQIKFAIAAVLIALSALAAWVVQGYRLDAANARYDLLVGQADADAKIKADKLRKEISDAENKITTDNLCAYIERLRRERSSKSFVPAPASGSASSDRACFDRGELEQAIRAFDSAVSGIVDKGSAATIDLNTAKLWAQGG